MRLYPLSLTAFPNLFKKIEKNRKHGQSVAHIVY